MTVWKESTDTCRPRKDPCKTDAPQSPRYPCCIDTRPEDPPCKSKPPPWVSMWEEPLRIRDEAPVDSLLSYPPECCPKCDITRFDELYYRPSNKCRRYQRTWWECCPRMVPKRVCCWCDAVPPEVERRCPELFPQTACDFRDPSAVCQSPKDDPCPRVQMPCCRSARVPPKCHRIRRKACCVKKRCPFPSYSECLKEDLAELHERPPECRCLAEKSACFALRYGSHMKKMGLKLHPCQKNYWSK